MTARPACKSDLPTLVELWKRFMAEEHEAVPDSDPAAALAGWSERLRSQIARGQVSVLGEDTGAAGFAAFIDSVDRPWIPEGVAYVVDLYVQPEARRAVAARTLMASLIDRVAEAGYREIWTNTAVTNRRMQVLLQRAGFVMNVGFSIPGLGDQVYLRREMGGNIRQPYPILEFDPTPEAVIEPRRLTAPTGVPEHCVICFFQEVIEGLQHEGRVREIARQRSEQGGHPVYELDMNGKRLAVFHPGVGAPLAAALLEEVIALGCSKFIACGGAGVLDKDVTAGRIIVPVSAVRDEGTSYHYLPPGREVAPSAEAVAAIERVLDAHHCDYVLGKTWTTDAFYRETPGKVRLRRTEGCLTVEMEAAAFFAVAKFRGVVFGQMLYAGDDVSGPEWDDRRWHGRTSAREALFWLAAESCLLL